MERDELAFAGVVRQAELIRAGEVSSRELVELYLDRIERLDPELNAFRTAGRRRRCGASRAPRSRRGWTPRCGAPSEPWRSECARSGTRWWTATPATVARRTRGPCASSPALPRTPSAFPGRSACSAGRAA